MSTASRTRIAIIGAIACAALVLGAFSFASAQTNTCPAGQQPATASDIATMLAAGINSPVVGMCWTPSSNQIGTQAAQAKQYLQSDVCPGNSIDTADLNTGFALCAQKFVQAAKAQDSGFCLTSAYRSVASQQAIVAANDAKFKCPANTWCPTMAGYIAQPGTSFHQYGLAVDVKTTMSLQTLWSLASAQGLTNPDTLHTSDPYHIQSPSKTSAICNSGGSGPTTVAGGSKISITPGLGGAGQALGFGPSQSLAGQIATQDSVCLVSTDPVYTVPVPAGTPYPSNCLNNTLAAGMCSAQIYCAGNVVMYQSSSCVPTQGQTCPYGCSNGTCIQQQQLASSQPTQPTATPPTGAGSGTSGTTGSSGGTGTTGTTQTGNVAGGTQTGTTQTGTTGSSNGTSGSGGSNVSTPTLAQNNGSLASPAISPIAGTSTLALINQLANETPPALTVTAATDTPVVLNPDDSQISQLNQSAPTGVTYAQPTSSYFSNQSGAANGGQGSGNGYNVTTQTGYQDSSNGNTTSGSGTIAGTQAPSGADTFGQQPIPAPVTESSSFAGVSANTFGVLTLLNTMKGEVEGALAFLQTYGQPFQGNIPSQNAGE